MSRNSQSRPRFQCACVQFNVKRGEVAHNLDAAVQGIRAAAEAGAELIVLPEMWPTSFVKETPDELLRASRDAEQRIAELPGVAG